MREITCGGGRRRGEGAIPRAVPVGSRGRRRFFSSSRDAAAALLARRHLYTDRPADGRRVGCFWRTAAGEPPDPRLREYAWLPLLARSGGGPLAFEGYAGKELEFRWPCTGERRKAERREERAKQSGRCDASAALPRWRSASRWALPLRCDFHFPFLI
jgi:hypothetical protein